MGGTGYILVTGSRNAPNWLRATVRTKLRGLVSSGRAHSGGLVDTFEILVGDASGVDEETTTWLAEQTDPLVRLYGGRVFRATWGAACEERCTPGHRIHRADGSSFCPAQGPYRNQRMVEIAKTLQDAGHLVRVAAFYENPRSKGTADCVRSAEAAGLIVRRYGNAPEGAF